ncbi:MAG: HNH endonuclease [Flavobacteriales bacterium]|nr:HNH endonuclease [Flavobacteriales bacterium]
MKDDLTLKEAFETILSIESLSDPICDIAEKIWKYGAGTSREDVQEIIKKHNIKGLEDLKEELLGLIIRYINITLSDNHLTNHEKGNIEFLKVLFGVKEGDFYDRFDSIYDEMGEVLHVQLSKIYQDDDMIDDDEALFKVELQALFDLGYDQFLEFANMEDQQALDRGAKLIDLDTVYPAPEEISQREVAGRTISQTVKDLVWNRDGRKCVSCGSNEKLEFDHIIPFSKGGSNTYRNVQLLCEHCNRSKSDKIGG